MITSVTMSREDSIHEIIKLVNSPPNKFSVLQSIRVARMKLGCALEQLEDFEPAPSALEQLHDHAEHIADQIDDLLRTTHQFLGR
jgi:hypothetical protein